MSMCDECPVGVVTCSCLLSSAALSESVASTGLSESGASMMIPVEVFAEADTAGILERISSILFSTSGLLGRLSGSLSRLSWTRSRKSFFSNLSMMAT